MKICLLTDEKNSLFLKRLQLLGHHVQTAKSERIESLAGGTTDVVYLVPFERTTRPSWSEERVLLARAVRFFIVYGASLSTSDIMSVARDGAHDVLDEVDSDQRWHEAIEAAANSQALWLQLYGGSGQSHQSKLLGRSGSMRSLRESIQRLGPTDATVLIMGESGTGKERVSEAIHEASGKSAFVPVNCAAIPSELLESELFGVEKGAFTGANRSKPGLVEEASGGTLFLDEIGEMDITVQPKLLRFLETRRARRVGSTKEYNCNLRVVSATNRDLRAEGENGRFRLDLYYRLSEVIINTSPLRHRVDDIPDLAQLFLQGASERLGKNFEMMEPELIYKFQHHDWPGNVRELKQTIERLAIHYNGPVMRAAWWQIPEGSRSPGTVAPFTNFPPEKREAMRGQRPPSSNLASIDGPQPSRSEPGVAPSALPSTGRMHKKAKLEFAKKLLGESGGDLGWTAAQLGIHPTTLYRWRKSGKL